MPMVAASILSADFARMGEECRAILAAGADALHVDVMDGHFVPNLTMGPDMVRAVRRACPIAAIDVHLMVTDPAQYVDAFLQAGADHLTFHVEVVTGAKVGELIARIRDGGATAGLAINPPTPVEAILPYVEAADLSLVMSVNPGFSGQKFIPGVLEKVRAIAERLQPDQRLEMDGGLNPSNVGACLDAGCDLVVAASAIFGLPESERRAGIKSLRGLVDDR
jgi:ribulose-phosphate 3-epimerase